jgi:hypothetical protein
MNDLFLGFYPQLARPGHALMDEQYRRESDWAIWLDSFNASRLHQQLLEDARVEMHS